MKSLLVSGFIFLSSVSVVFAANPGDVVFNEVAWMGTKANSADEWIELKNNTGNEIDLSGFGIYKNGGATLIISLTKKIPAGGFYLIERTDDSAVNDISADDAGPFAANGLSNSGEHLVLKDAGGVIIDSMPFAGGWPAGIASPDYKTMERVGLSWQTHDGVVRNGVDVKGNPINGTPKAVNSTGSSAPLINNDGTDNATTTEQVLDALSLVSGVRVAMNPLRADAGEDMVTRVGDDIFFDGTQSVGINTMSYVWNFGDGATKTGKTVVYRYAYPGTYFATLVISDGVYTHEDQVTVRVYASSVLISEFMPLPYDGNEGWIEIANSADYGVDVSGWGLSMEKEKSGFIIPANTFISSKGYLVLRNSITKLVFNTSKGTMRLIYPNGQIASEIVYNKPAQGRSAALTAEGEYVWTVEQSPGMKNIIARHDVKASKAVSSEVVVSPQLSYANNEIRKMAVYEKHGDIKSFLGEPAQARVADFSEETVPESAMKAYAGGAFSWSLYTATLFIITVLFFGVRFLKNMFRG